MLFQNKLKELRKEKNISQYDLADALNISRSVVAKWENGLTLPSEESIRLLMDYFNVSREELFKNEETEPVIAKKNASILKMKKFIIYLSSAMVVLIVTTIIVFNSLTPKSLSKQLYKLGKFEDVKISLYDTNNGERYYLNPNEENLKVKALSLLDTVEYRLYSKGAAVPEWIGAYTIILEGKMTIEINAAYLSIDGNYRAVKEYTPNTISKVIDLLISSDGIDLPDEYFNQ